MAKHNETGKIGEDIAAEYLTGKGWIIVERNFRRPYGEIDIVARLPGSNPFGRGETRGLLVFVEVKTVSHGTVPHETYRPEENIHPQKLRRLGNTIQAYLAYKRHEGDWRFDVLAVFLNPATKEAKIRHIEDVIIGA